MTSKDVEKLKVIGYYRIKQFAAPLIIRKLLMKILYMITKEYIFPMF